MKETSLGIHKNSHTISKVVENHPKIRIIHIYAPQIIKTDVVNFRELVQKLTGKPSTTTITAAEQKVKKVERKTKSKSREDEDEEEEEEIKVFRSGFDYYNDKEEEDRMIIKEEEKEEIWKGTHDMMNIDNASGGFLSGFADLDGCFMQPQQPSSHLMHFFGETQLLS